MKLCSYKMSRHTCGFSIIKFYFSVDSLLSNQNVSTLEITNML